MQSTRGTNSILNYFDSHTLQKGRAYERNSRVQTVLTTRAESGMQHVRAKVRGREQYTAELQLSADASRILDSRCSCPMYADCKHAAALAIAFVGSSSGTKPVSINTLEHDTLLQRQPNRRQIQVEEERAERAPEDALAELTQAIPRDYSQMLGEIGALFQATQESGVVAVSSALVTKPKKSAMLYVIEPELHSWYAIGTPKIAAAWFHILKDGTFGRSPNDVDKIRILNTQERPPQYVSTADLRILNDWFAATEVSTRPQRGWAGSFAADFTSFKSTEDLVEILEAMTATGRCRYQSQFGPVLNSSKPMPGRFVWTEQADGTFKLMAVAESDEPSVISLPWHFPFYVDTKSGALGPIHVADLNSSITKKILSLRAVRKIELRTVPLMLAQAGLEDVVPTPPGQKKISVSRVTAHPELNVDNMTCRRALTLGDQWLSNAGQKVRVLSVKAPVQSRLQSTRVRFDLDRNLVIENISSVDDKLLNSLRDLGLKHVSAEHFEANKDCTDLTLFIGDAQAWVKLASEVGTLREKGWSISPQTESELKPIELDDDALEFDASYKNDDEREWWFSLSLNIDVNGQKVALLPILLSAIRRLPSNTPDITDSLDFLNEDGKFFATLADGRTVSLPFDRVRYILTSLQELIVRGEKGEKLEVSMLHAADLLKSQFLSAANWTGSERIAEFVSRLRRLTKIKPLNPPAEFQATLRPYQKEGLGWLQHLAEQRFGGILADDMGLGKTVQLLAHICLQRAKLKSPFLVVCPTSVLPNWISEAAKFAPHLKVVAFYGTERFLERDNLASADIVVTTYPLLTRDISELRKIRWHGIALDEAQVIKNPSTQVANAVRSLESGYRFCLTGTPIENHLGELWSHFQFLLPGLLGDQTNFNRQIRNPIEKSANLSLKSALSGRIKPFILRRTKQQVAPELPKKTVIVQPIELNDAQRDLYETVRVSCLESVRKEVEQKGFKQSQIIILDALLKLRQVCCDPRLVKLKAASKVRGSAKLEHLLDMLRQLVEEGRKILLFSQFTSMLDLIGPALQAEGIDFAQLRGDTKDRKTPVDRFQNGEVPIFLISLKAGGTGLNLTAADVVIHYDPWWNPAVEDQATDRAHRLGQTKNVFVYKFIAQGTIEQRMLELQARKRALANSLYDDKGGLSTSFTESDLEALLRPMDSLTK